MRTSGRAVGRLRGWAALLVIGWLWLAGGGAAEAALRAGVAKAELTPPVGTPLGGYADRNGKGATGVHDPLWAKALVLDDGKTRVAIVTTDLIGSNPEVTQAVAKRTGFPRERLLLCASHTHSGPGAYAKGAFAFIVLGAYDQKIFDLMVDRIATAIEQAQKAMVPARFGVGTVDFPAYVRNRRKGSTITDPQLTVVRVDQADGKPVAALVNYTAHGTVLDSDNMLVSADWMGVTQALLEKEVPGLTALYANGAEGDQSPSQHDDQRGFPRSESIGTAVGKKALALYQEVKTGDALRITTASAEVTLPETPNLALLAIPKQTFIQAFGLNDALLISVPGEMIAELGLQLKQHARGKGWKTPVIMGLANEHLGYLLTEAEYKKGGYERQVSFFGETFGDQLTGELKKLIDRISHHRDTETQRGTTE